MFKELELAERILWREARVGFVVTTSSIYSIPAKVLAIASEGTFAQGPLQQYNTAVYRDFFVLQSYNTSIGVRCIVQPFGQYL